MKNKHARRKEEREISESLCGWYCGILKYYLTLFAVRPEQFSASLNWATSKKCESFSCQHPSNAFWAVPHFEPKSEKVKFNSMTWAI
jgi:hypothetical protein